MKLTRRRLLKFGFPTLAAGFGAAGAYSALVEPHRLSLERVAARLPKLPAALEGFRIAVLSDFHLHPFTKIDHVQETVRLANGLRPDLSVLLGDYVDATVDAIHELAPELGRLNARCGVFGILGNHDYWKGAKVVIGALEKAGISVLENSGVPLTVEGSTLYLAGLESAWAGRPDISQALATRRGDLPTILLAHEPDYADRAVRDGRIALQLSGHSHGGQVRLPGIGALQLPSWGRRYDHGLYHLGNMQLYTNRGIGLVKLPVRFNCPPEVTEITLQRG
jgi:predicted MPP superfamily phosphohydrolase